MYQIFDFVVYKNVIGQCNWHGGSRKKEGQVAGVTPLAVIGAAIVFLLKISQRGMKTDPDAASKIFKKIFSTSRSEGLSVIATFGKNEHVKNVFRAVFVTLAGIILTQVVDPATAQQVVGAITGR